MPKDYPRSQRVEELAREVLGEAISQLKDPRIGFVTVTGVKMTADLRKATVHVSVLGDDEQREDSIGAIQRATHHLRTVLGREVRLKFLPQLEIVEDTTAILGERLDSLLKRPAEKPSEGAES